MVSHDTYVGWDIKIMSISHFRHIYSAYHRYFGDSAVGDKFHQLRFILRCINQSAARAFYFGPNVDFDEGISTHSHLFCVRKFNKDKPY